MADVIGAEDASVFSPPRRRGKLTTMPRRFQFSLRALLGLAAVVCLLLGGRHLASRAQYIEALPAKVGQPIYVYGRLISFWGGPEIDYYIAIDSAAMAGTSRRAPPPKSDHGFDRTIWERYAERSWLCVYDLDARLEVSGEYAFTVGEYPLGVTTDRSRIELPLRGKLIVESR